MFVAALENEIVLTTSPRFASLGSLMPNKPVEVRYVDLDRSNIVLIAMPGYDDAGKLRVTWQPLAIIHFQQGMEVDDLKEEIKNLEKARSCGKLQPVEPVYAKPAEVEKPVAAPARKRTGKYQSPPLGAQTSITAT